MPQTARPRAAGRTTNEAMSMLTLLLPSLLAAPQQPQTASELLPLQPLCAHERDVTTPQWRTLLRYVRRHSRNADLVCNEEDGDRITPSGIYEALEQLEPDAIGEGLLSVTPIGDNLLVFGQRADVARVGKRIDEATKIVARPLELEFAVWDAASRETPRAVMSADDYARFAGQRPPLWRTVTSGRAGQPVTLKNMTWTHYVRSLDIEVAQKQTMSRPSTERYGEGCHAAVRAHSLIGSDEFAVHAQFAAGKARGVTRSIQTGLPGAADIELPRLETCYGVFSGRVANGGALAVTLRGNASGGGQIILTLRVRSTVQPTTLSDPTSALLPVGALTSAALTQRALLHGPFEPDDAEALSFDEEGVYGHVPPDLLTHLVEGIAETVDDSGQWSIRHAGNYLFVQAQEQTVAAITATLRKLQDRVVRNVEVQHTGALGPQLDGGEQLGDAPPLHELVLPTLLGREFVAVRVHETNVVDKVYVEIAQESGALAPGVELLQSGAWLRGRAVPITGGMHLDLDVQVANAPTPPMRNVMPGGGVLMPTSVSITRRSHDGFAAGDQTIQHGDGPTVQIEGRGYSSSLSTTLRR